MAHPEKYMTSLDQAAHAHVDAVAAVFAEEELDGVLWQAIAINACNRQAVTKHTRAEPATA